MARLSCIWAYVFAVSIVLMGATESAIDLRAPLPNGDNARIRLKFQQDVQIEAKKLPRVFRSRASLIFDDWIVFNELSPKGKRWALRAMFPNDKWNNDRVVHVVRWPKLESVWFMASLFMGNGQRHDRLQTVNHANSDKLKTGDQWVIPSILLSEDLGGKSNAFKKVIRHQPEDEPSRDSERMAAFRALLTFERDSDGRSYAGYRVRKGEALYSNVVMRYTDHIDHKGVNDLALEIARRSGISDVRKIQPGQLVKIPISVLASPFQPKGTLAFKEDLKMRTEARKVRRVSVGTHLRGVHVVLDAGHGGIDKGAMANGVWESDYVYDIAMRVRRLLEQGTEAMVSCTIRYPSLEFNIRNWIDVPSNDAEILTTPPFANDGESANNISVHLRWILANQMFNSFNKNGDSKKTLFISFHADSLHPSARGTMVYVPGAVGVPTNFVLTAPRLAKIRELSSGSKVSFTPMERLQGEIRSRMFAESILGALQEEGIPTHENRPIRSVVMRGDKSFIPAVIRYSVAATKVLLEVLNLTNIEDAGNLKSSTFREHYAQAIVKGIKAYYRP